MSPRNLEIVRSVVEALLEADYDRALAAFDPEAEWQNTSEFPGPRICRGPNEIKAFWMTLFEEFNRAGMELEDATECGENVAVAIHSWGTGRASGAPVDVRWASVYRLREDRVVRVEVYGEYEDAVQSARSSIP